MPRECRLISSSIAPNFGQRSFGCHIMKVGKISTLHKPLIFCMAFLQRSYYTSCVWFCISNPISYSHQPKFSYVFTPIGLYNGIRSTKNQKVPHIPLLEEYYQLNKRPLFTDIQVSFRFLLILRLKALSKKLDLNEAQVSYWFRAKRNSSKFPVIVKFAESG